MLKAQLHVLTFSSKTMADTSNKQVQNSGGTFHKISGALLSGVRDSKTGLMLSYKHLKLKQRVFTVAMHAGPTQWNLKEFLISHIMGQLCIHAIRIMMIDLYSGTSI